MSGGVDDTQKLIGIANLNLTNTSFELNGPIEKCQTALGILALVQEVVKEMRETANDIGVDLTTVLGNVSKADEHLTNSSVAQRFLGINQPSSPAHEMFIETGAASKVVGEVKERLTEGVEITTTREADTFMHLSVSLEGMKPPLDSALNLLKDAQQRNVDAVEAANAFMETI